MKTYTEAQVIAALDAIAAGHSATKPSNLANRFQAMLDAASPAMLKDLATALELVAGMHPSPAGECVHSLATEMLAESYSRSTERE